MRRVLRHNRYRCIRADQLAHAARIDDDVLVGLEIPVAEQRLQHRRRGGFVVRRIEKDEHVSALFQEPLQRVGFRLEQVGARTGGDDDGGVGGDIFFLRQHQLGDVVVVATQRGLHLAVAVALHAVDVLLAMPLEEVDLLLVRIERLDEAARQVLFVGGRHLFASSLVVDDDGAVALNLVLLGFDRLLVHVHVLDVHLRRRFVAVLVE